MKIPFVKAHGAHNDFLLTWKHQLPSGSAENLAMSTLATAICERHTGQQTAEQHPFDDQQPKKMMDIARKGVESLVSKQRAILKNLPLRQ